MKNIRSFLKTWTLVVLTLSAFAYPSVSLFIFKMLLNLLIPALLFLLIKTIRENKRLRASLKREKTLLRTLKEKRSM